MTDLQLPGWELLRRGMDRVEYVSGDRVLLVMDDRMTLEGSQLPEPIPGRGEVRARLTSFWFQRLDFVPNNFLSADPTAFPDALRPAVEVLGGRAWLGRRVPQLPVVAMVRGYLTGSAWKEYEDGGTVGGHQLPRGLREGARLPEPIFSALERAEGAPGGPVGWEKCRQLLGDDTAHDVREAGLEIYDHARAHAEKAGVIVAESRLEFGLMDEELLLIGECLTPDVSLLWRADGWAPGKLPSRWERQALTEWQAKCDWAGQLPVPPLPEDVIHRTAESYREIYQRLALGRPPA